MKPYTTVKRRLQVLLHSKPSPLQKGDKLPYVFVHINKTAGTSVGNAIGLATKHHLTVKEIISIIGKSQWESAYKFTFVRNPWDKTVSLYEYRRKKNKTQIAKRAVSFDEWVIKTMGEEQDTFFYDNPKSFQPQVEWLKDEEDQICMDYIGKFENLNTDFEQIRTAVGVEAQLPHLNASSRAPYQSYYSSKTRDIVAKWFNEDIKRFSYSFES